MTNNIQRLAALFMIGFLAMSGAFLYWQVIQASELTSRPDNARLANERLREQRGRILDRNGRELAINVVDKDGYVRRRYTDPSLSQVIGYSSLQFGSTGLEDSFDKYLSGQEGAGPWTTLERRLLHRPVQGNDLMLTIDRDLQAQLDKLLGDGPSAGAILNPKTGEVLAMVSKPYFDANQLVFDPTADDWQAEGERVEAYWRSLNNAADSPLLNRVTQGQFVPGSTFKIVTAAAAIERGQAKLDDHFEFTLNPPDAKHTAAWHANDYVSCQNHPEVTSFDLRGAFAYSCNVVFADLALKTGSQSYLDYARRFGLDSQPPFDVPVAKSHSSTRADFFTANERNYALASTGMGQGELLVTPLQMALIGSTIANGGSVPKPMLVSEVRSPNGSVVSKLKPDEWRRAISPTTAGLVKELMVSAVQTGYASPAATPGLKVAGKTGTAETGRAGKTHAWFVSFAPADDPQIAMAIVKEFGGSGSHEVAPLAKTIYETYLLRRGAR
ncbi:MAG: penicillin-binding protein 2 [Chloroflexota bacterium]|nr:MAG: penicillin-binding protein 2 [Chloroflexota bacterium]